MTATAREWRQVLDERLKERDLRLTRQRTTISEVFFVQSKHLNVDELLGLVREQDPRIGHATVYRTLKLFSELGLAEEHHFGDGSTRYEPDLGRHHHDHLICKECGHIIEFENDEIERLQEEVAEGLGFELVDHRMELYGVCADFRRTGEKCQ